MCGVCFSPEASKVKLRFHRTYNLLCRSWKCTQLSSRVEFISRFWFNLYFKAKNLKNAFFCRSLLIFDNSDTRERIEPDNTVRKYMHSLLIRCRHKIIQIDGVLVVSSDQLLFNIRTSVSQSVSRGQEPARRPLNSCISLFFLYNSHCWR